MVLQEKLIDLTEKTFKREGSSYLACNDRNAFFPLEKKNKKINPINIMHGLVKNYVMC